MKVKEVGIARDNEASFAVDGKFKEFVVPRIAARMDHVNDWDHLGDVAEETQKILPFFNGNVGIEFGARENVGQFLKSGFGDDKLGFFDSPADSLATRRPCIAFDSKMC